MALFEASDSDELSFLPVSEVTINCDVLLDRIHHKLVMAWEKGFGEWVVVVTQEEFRALQYWGKIYNGGVVRVAHQEFLTKMKNRPITGIAIFGTPVIGSEFIGELSPFIL